MIVHAKGASDEAESIEEKVSRFLDMMDEDDEEIKFIVGLGQSSEAKFRVSSAINTLEELRDNHEDLLEEHDCHWELGDALEMLENLSWALDERVEDDAE